MKKLALILLCVLPVVGCAKADARPSGLRVTPLAAAGDTLAYTVSWTAGARATNYDFLTTVAATNGTWSVIYGSTFSGPLPQSGTTTGLLFTMKLIAIPWDSATFTVTLASRNAAGSSPSINTSWSVKRKPGPPGPPKIDSSATVTGLLVRPDSVRFTAIGQTRQLCPFLKFAGGAVALAESQVYRPICDSVYVRVFTAAQRALSAAQRLCADSGGTFCATGTGLREWQAGVTLFAASGDTVRVTATYGLDATQPFKLVAVR